MLRHEGQGGERPALQGRVVILGLLEGGEVAEGPGNLIAAALEIPLAAGPGLEERSEVTRDRRLLGEDDFHGMLRLSDGCLGRCAPVIVPGEYADKRTVFCSIVQSPGAACEVRL